MNLEGYGFVDRCLHAFLCQDSLNYPTVCKLYFHLVTFVVQIMGPKELAVALQWKSIGYR